MNIKEIRAHESPNTISVHRDGKGIPMFVRVWADTTGNSNQMALPRQLGTYFQTKKGWEYSSEEY